jgi:diguanylate cyclase (GGDEF)-like protein
VFSRKRSHSERAAIGMRVRELVRVLGRPSASSRVSVSDRLPRVERLWECGCHASAPATKDSFAYWFPCVRHEVTYFAAQAPVARNGSARASTPVAADAAAKSWRVPAVMLGSAFIAKSVYDSFFLLKRAEDAEGASLVDPLTGLYNRRGWNRRVLEERKRIKRDSGAVATVYMLDVDGLKATNDERGHSAGDALLRQVSQIIKQVTREHDVAARLGGDEFAVLTVQSQAAEADLIRARLDRGFTAHGLSVSVGFAFVQGSETVEEAMERADAVMYDAKKKKYASR